MNTEVDAVGLYPLAADSPCHLIELRFDKLDAPFDVGAITQPIPGEPSSDWQAPYLERFLDPSGTQTVADYGTAPLPPEIWGDGLRLAFFFHDLDISQPLQTPFGLITLPPESPLPERLQEMVDDYDEP